MVTCTAPTSVREQGCARSARRRRRAIATEAAPTTTAKASPAKARVTAVPAAPARPSRPTNGAAQQAAQAARAAIRLSRMTWRSASLRSTSTELPLGLGLQTPPVPVPPGLEELGDLFEGEPQVLRRLDDPECRDALLVPTRSATCPDRRPVIRWLRRGVVPRGRRGPQGRGSGPRSRRTRRPGEVGPRSAANSPREPMRGRRSAGVSYA